MWLEVKIVFSIISMVFIGIVLSQLIFLNMLFSFLLIMSIGMIIISDLLIGSKIKACHADKIIDHPPLNMEFWAMITLNNLLDFGWAVKKPYGKREFMYHGQEASYYNNGDAQIHTLNGNHGCLIHEDHDENLNPDETRIAAKIADEYQTKNIKDVYYKTKFLEKKGNTSYD